jgi:hypothetical protein
MGWGTEQLLEDWSEVVKVQNQATLDGSPVTQAIIKFIEDKQEYTGPFSELHKRLEGVAEGLSVSIVKDKAWPKSAQWLWRRIKEVLPVLMAAGIDAKREHPDTGTVITLHKLPRNDASNASNGEDRTAKGNTAGNNDGANVSSNASRTFNASANASDNPARDTTSGNTGNTGNRYGNSWESDSTRHYRRGGTA